MNDSYHGVEVAILGGGCFWCTEAIYRSLRGVHHVESGYCGGTVENPSYDQVCTGATGHAEVVRISFDPAQISYALLLEVFFKTHNPTTLNRQGGDTGTQYRSVIFYQNTAQHEFALKAVQAAGRVWTEDIVTEIAAAQIFYPAEKVHQSYFERNQDAPYCAAVIGPKVEKFQREFRSLIEFI